MPGAYHRLRFAAADGGAVEIETTRPELLPACVALVAHPDDERYQPLFGTRRDHAALRRARAGGGASARRSGEGQRHRDDLHLRRPHRRHLVARAEAAGARGHPGQRHARPGHVGQAGLGVGRRRRAAQAAYDQLAGLSAKKAQARWPSCCGESGDLVGEPRPITHHVKFYEKGDRPLEIVTSRQWFIKTIEFRDELLARGRELQWHPAYMRARYENWVNGLNGDWCISRQRFFGVPFPVWYPRARRMARSTTHAPLRARRGAAADRSVDRRARRVHRRPARPARRLRRRSRRHGHLGDLVAHAADRRPAGSAIRTCSRARSRWTCGRRRTTSSAPGCSRRCCAPTSSTTRCRGRTRRSPAGCSTPTARRCRSRRATSSRRWALLRGVRLGRRALLGGARRPRRRHRVRRRPDEDRPAPGDQAAERVEVRAGARRGERRDHPAARSRHADRAGGAGRRGDRRARRLRVHARARAHRERSSGASATTTSSWSSRGATAIRASRGRRLGERARCRWRCRSCCGCSRRTCRS